MQLTISVSYTHLDVYKRQVPSPSAPVLEPQKQEEHRPMLRRDRPAEHSTTQVKPVFTSDDDNDGGDDEFDVPAFLRRKM